MSEECVFCSIVSGEIPASVVKQTERWIAFLDAEPVSKGHTLVIPKKHVETIHEAGEMEFMWDAIVKVSRAINQAFDPEGMNIDQNNGEIAGQEVPHLHFHLTPRYTGEEIEVSYDRSDLEDGGKIAEQIKAQMT